MPITSDEDYEKAAQRLRRHGGIDERFRPDVIFFPEQLKLSGTIKDYMIVPDHELPDDEAYYNSSTEIIYLRASTFAALDHPHRVSKQEYQHLRFTVAHEAGHAARGHEGTHFRGATSQLAKKIPSRVRRNEWEANRMASAILAPYHLAEPVMRVFKTVSLTAEHISELFGINFTAATIAKERIDRLYRRAHNLPRPLPPGIAEHLRERQVQGFKITSLEIEERRQRSEARSKGYEDTLCGKCKCLTLKRIETGLKCDTCGSAST